MESSAVQNSRLLPNHELVDTQKHTLAALYVGQTTFNQLSQTDQNDAARLASKLIPDAIQRLFLEIDAQNLRRRREGLFEFEYQ